MKKKRKINIFLKSTYIVYITRTRSYHHHNSLMDKYNPEVLDHPYMMYNYQPYFDTLDIINCIQDINPHQFHKNGLDMYMKENLLYFLYIQCSLINLSRIRSIYNHKWGNLNSLRLRRYLLDIYKLVYFYFLGTKRNLIPK